MKQTTKDLFFHPTQLMQFFKINKYNTEVLDLEGSSPEYTKLLSFKLINHRNKSPNFEIHPPLIRKCLPLICYHFKSCKFHTPVRILQLLQTANINSTRTCLLIDTRLVTFTCITSNQACIVLTYQLNRGINTTQSS